MEADSVIYGLLGRMHVLMRRVSNRITDVEYMRVSKDYCREIVRLAEATDNEELHNLAERLRQAMDLQAGDSAAPMAARKGGLLDKLLHHAPVAPESPEDKAEGRYVRSLR
jgi:hypothetical protein